MATIYINSMSIIAPGIMDRTQALSILRGECDWQHVPMGNITPGLLPANERRRTTALIKLALKAGQEAMLASGEEYAVASVFASSESDPDITDKICKALLLEDKPVSPTQFHNSVFNAAAGYWAIAAKSKKPSVSLSAGDASFTTGLLEAVSQVIVDAEPVLLVAYDYPAPPLLDAMWHIDFPYATALLLSSRKSDNCLASITVEAASDGVQPSMCASQSLEIMRHGNPVARSLPLLEAIAAEREGTVILPYINQQTVLVRVWP